MKNSDTIRTVDCCGCIAIPRKIREACDIIEGDQLEICYDEKAQTVTLKRYKIREELRKEWVNKWFREYSTTLAVSKRVGNMTIVAWNNRIETAQCRREDTYDRRVGEAICMARLCGERIPEYI